MIHLERLVISYNQLATLDTDVFDDFDSILEIRLLGNDLTELPDLSAVADTLQELHIQRNSISTIPTGTISSLIHLEELDLSNNDLNSFPFDELIPLSNLQILNLKNNDIVSLPEVQGLNLVTLVNTLCTCLYRLDDRDKYISCGGVDHIFVTLTTAFGTD